MEVSLIERRMPRLVFIVEGDAEQHFINRHLVDYLSRKHPGVWMHAQKMTTNRQKNKKGGNVSYALFENELKRTAAQGNVLITTMLDFFRIPNDFPGYSTDVRTIDVMENSIRTDCSAIPSKRLLSIFNYKKVADSILVMSDVNIDQLRSSCPRFDEWVGKLECALKNGHF